MAAAAATPTNRKLLGAKKADCIGCGWGGGYNPYGGWGGGYNPYGGWGGGYNPYGGWGGGNSWSQASANAQSGSFGGPWGGSSSYASASANAGSVGGVPSGAWVLQSAGARA
jgi:hypothetical protein